MQGFDVDLEVLGSGKGVEGLVVVSLVDFDLGDLVDRSGDGFFVRVVFDCLLVADDGFVVVALFGVDQAFEVEDLGGFGVLLQEFFNVDQGSVPSLNLQEADGSPQQHRAVVL